MLVRTNGCLRPSVVLRKSIQVGLHWLCGLGVQRWPRSKRGVGNEQIKRSAWLRAAAAGNLLATIDHASEGLEMEISAKVRAGRLCPARANDRENATSNCC